MCHINIDCKRRQDSKGEAKILYNLYDDKSARVSVGEMMSVAYTNFY